MRTLAPSVERSAKLNFCELLQFAKLQTCVDGIISRLMGTLNCLKTDNYVNSVVPFYIINVQVDASSS